MIDLPISAAVECADGAAGRSEALIVDRATRRVTHLVVRVSSFLSTADHLVPRSCGGTADPANLRASCGHCNSARGDGRTDTQTVQSSVTTVTRVAGEAGRGIRSSADRRPARTAR